MVCFSTSAVDDVLNVRVHTLLRLSLRLNDEYLNDLLSEGNSKGFDILLHRTLFHPVLGKSLLDFHPFLHNLRNWNVNDMLHSLLLDSVLGDGLRHFHQLFHHLRHGNIKSLFHCTLQGSVSA